jgi:2-oxoglutarate dehydrogenase E1 component
MSQSIFDNFGSNSGYIEDMYELFLKDPKLVGPSWSDYFSRLATQTKQSSAINLEEIPDVVVSSGSNGTSNIKEITKIAYNPSLATGSKTNYQSPSSDLDGLQERIYRMVSAFRNRGHLRATINPLTKGVNKLPVSEDVNPEYYNFTDEQLNSIRPCAGFKGNEQMRLADLVVEIEKAYCGYIGFEIGHLHVQEERLWLQQKIEKRLEQGVYKLTNEQKINHLKKIVNAEAFEAELHKKYIGQKRFSLQGGETVIPLINTILDEAAQSDIKEAVLGMAHRGRLNILRNVLGKSLADIFSEFEDQNIFTALGSGDVKYHLGYEGKYKSINGGVVGLTLAPNPSHLEFVYPVVEGIVRAKQDLEYNRNRSAALGIILHGDAAFIGQGIVTEALNMTAVDAHHNGGSIHVVINNQVGFTTSPDESRSSVYCTDFAKAIQAPIFHINGDNVEAACWAAKTAVEFSERYGRDVVLDLYCFRKYGHNEGDDPSYTQPILYSGIKDKKLISEIYSEQLEKEGVIKEGFVKELFEEYAAMFSSVDKQGEKVEKVLGEACSVIGKIIEATPLTKASKENLEKVANTLTDLPADFTIHPKLKKIIDKRVATLTDGENNIDWGFAEGLAFGTLVLDNINVRLCGQDCGRGTFSQRHLELTDYKTGEAFLPFDVLRDNDKSAHFEVFNSILSESAVLAYEFGYSVFAKDRSLVLWEAQFGDFANGAQVIIDQFISSSEQKWNQLSGLTMLLPHGYEGQGPEHSSARLERYLQACADGNMRVCVPSNASQHFHLMRLQGLTKVTRPLIVMTPKSLLRAPKANASLEDLTTGRFKQVIRDKTNKKHKNLLLLSGKVYYDVKDYLEEKEVTNLEIIRVEQLYPFPRLELTEALKKDYPDFKFENIFWLQEEPKNMGGFSFIEPYLREFFSSDIKYIGRDKSASTATGSGKRHALETERFLGELVDSIS